MKDLEALMLDLLLSVSLNILLEHRELSLVCLDWVAQIILVDVLLVVTKEGSNGLDACS